MVFSIRSNVLDESAVERYHKNGFLIASDLLTRREKADLRDWANEVQAWPETPGKWMQYFEANRSSGARQLCRTENFIAFHAGLRSLMCGEKVLASVGQLLGDEPAVLYKEKVNFKLPGANGFAPHQDAPAYTEQGQELHATVLVAVDATTLENGCLEVVAAGHQLGSLPHTEGNGAIPDDQVRQLEWEPVFLQPGDVMFFGSYLPHRSGPNLTALPRRAFYLTYNALRFGDRHDAYYEDKRRKFPPDCEREPGKDYAEGARVYNLANPIRYFD